MLNSLQGSHTGYTNMPSSKQPIENEVHGIFVSHCPVRLFLLFSP